MMCLDGQPCKYWFTWDGHCVCRHGLNEKNYGDNTSVELCCPLELQQEHEKDKWTKFFKDKPWEKMAKRFLEERRVE